MLHRDRPLLFGLVALERDLVGPAELIDAFRVWRQNPDRSLGQILASQGKLSHDGMQAIERYLSDSSLARQIDQPEDAAPTTTWRPDTTSVALNRATAIVEKTQNPDDFGARFRPLRLHATGGLGQVFEAEDRELRRRVALKEIRPHHADDRESRRRFVLEAEVTGNLEHPGIVPVYGLGAHPDGRPFYAMRFIEGQTLSQAIQKFRAGKKGDFASLEFRQLLARLVDVCNAVAFAHSRGVVHRDLKPQNVMLGPFGETLVVDWGLAKPLPSRESKDEAASSRAPALRPSADHEFATTTGDLVGTPAFMSPEQALGKVHDIGPASDVYSLGAILYVLLTGQSPRRGSALEIVQAAPHWLVPDVLAEQPRAPRSLAAICAKAMAREPAGRYASPLDLAADIERWLADEPTAAFTEPWLDTAFRWVRKHRLPVAVATALLLVTSVGLAIGYTLVRKERDVAELERGKAVAANQRAQENAAATRQVVQQFLIKISDDQFSNVPGFEDVRLQMVNLAVERYRALLAQQPDDPALEADAAMAFRRCANLYRTVGQTTEAQKLYDEALKHLRQAATRHAETGSLEGRFYETLCDQAALVRRTEGPQAAEPLFREAVEFNRRSHKLRPPSLAAQQAAARAEGDLADVLLEMGRHDESIALARAAAATFQQAAKSNPRDARNLATAGFSALNLSQSLREAGQPKEAEAVLESAIQQTQQYLQTNSRDANLRYVFARATLEQAMLHRETEGATDEVRKNCAGAVARLEQLAKEFPNTSAYRRKLAEGLTEQGQIDLARGELSPAATVAQQAIELLEQLDREAGMPAYVQPFLASAHSLLGEIEMQRGNAVAFRSNLEQAQRHIQRAQDANPDSPRLQGESRRIEALLQDKDRGSSSN